MKHFIFRDEKHVPYLRVSKTRAKKEFESGKDIVIVACNLHPFGFWNLGIKANINNFEFTPENERFEKLVNDYTWFNCNHETGYYPAYYVEVK